MLSFKLKSDAKFRLGVMVDAFDQRGAFAPDFVAIHEDASDTWEDHGPALITFKEPESPRVFEYNGTFYMFATSGYGRVLFKSKDPKSDNWEEVDFNWPENSPDAETGHWLGIWSGWEVVEHEGRLIFSAFYWKPHGGWHHQRP